MESKKIITVKEWFFDKVYEEMRKYSWYPVFEYVNVNGINMADHTKIHLENVLRETEKAFYIEIDAESMDGHPRAFKTWIPKSVIVG